MAVGATPEALGQDGVDGMRHLGMFPWQVTGLEAARRRPTVATMLLNRTNTRLDIGATVLS